MLFACYVKKIAFGKAFTASNDVKIELNHHTDN